MRKVDAERGEISIDFVVHGEHGVAGPWAASVKPGDPAYLMGPSGAYAPDPAADWHLLAGDEAGLPAISAALEAMPPDAVGLRLHRGQLAPTTRSSWSHPRASRSAGSTAAAAPTWSPRNRPATTRR